MARGVNDIDLIVLIADGGIFRQDRDAALPLQIAGVHDPVDHGLVFAVNTALLEHLIDQGRLAVVNVGDDRDVSDFILLRHMVRSLLSASLSN